MGFGVVASFATTWVVGVGWSDRQFAQYRSGVAFEDDDGVWGGFDDGDFLAFPALTDADLASAVVDLDGGRNASHHRARSAAAWPWITGGDLG